MNNIVIIGSGKLGSRHLQSLAALKKETNIFLVDPSEESLKEASELFYKSNPFAGLKLEIFNNISLLPNGIINIAIVATNSLVRRKVIEELTTKAKIEYLILEKFLFPEVKDYKIVEEIISKNNIKTWVNCPRRMFDYYKDLKSEMKDSSIITISGSLWGLGCNGIHMLDLIAYLTNEDDLILNTDTLDKTIIKSKREGYIEFTGKITGYTKSKKHIFIIACYAQEGIPLTISISTGDKNYIVSEPGKKLIVFSNSATNQTLQEKQINMLFQSQLTLPVVEQLLNTGNCELTTYKESSHLHLQFLNMLLNFMQLNSETKVEKCLIT
jgi:hypothetical protein